MINRRTALPLVALMGASSAGIASAQQRGGGRRRAPAETAPPLPLDAFEKNALAVLDDIDRNQRFLNVDRDDGRMLRIWIEMTGAKQVVEIGTSTGYSGIWLALGLKRTGGRLTTLEIDPQRAAAAKENFRRAGVGDLIDDVVGDARLETQKLRGPLDLVFSDADKEGYLAYFRTLAPLLRVGGLYISDNMAIPSPDPEYVRYITSNPTFETVFVNMHRTGTGVSLKRA